jgi:integrase/recombinase XerD
MRLNNPTPACVYCQGERTQRTGFLSSENQAYRCRDCRRMFSDTTIRRLSEKRPPCPYCENKFAQKLTKDKQGNQKYYCPSCRKVFPRSIPEKKELSDKQCPFCDSQGAQTAGITSAKNQRYRCKTCSKQFTDYTYLRLKQTIPVCLKCNGIHVQKYGFTKDGNQKYKCRDCLTKFTESTILNTITPICLFCGSSATRRRGYDTKGNQKLICHQCNKFFIQVPNGELFSREGRELKPVKPFHFDDDIWDVRSLGFSSIAPATRHYSISFTLLDQDWFKTAVKNFIKYTLSIASPGQALCRLDALNKLSKYLEQIHPGVQPVEINRSIIINFLSTTHGYAANTRQIIISSIRAFFEVCEREKWLETSSHGLIREEDYPRRLKCYPRYIPQEIVQQLNNHLHQLPEPITRMILVVQEVGMRISELCLLPLNCLSFDKDGTPWITYHHYKMKKDHSVPITIALSNVIRAQQNYIKVNLEDGFPYLFCGNSDHRGKGGYIARACECTSQSFSYYLKKLARENHICDSTGNLWEFQSHQFRHTVGTTMINNGTPQHIVQRYLGHESPAMTSVYAFIYDKTLSDEFAKFNQRMVNISGDTVRAENLIFEMTEGADINEIDAQWFKKNIRAQTLPNGLCTLPAIEKTCPFGANKCLTCTHFKTDVRYLETHREHLQRTAAIIDWANENPGSKRAVEILEINLPIQSSLQRIVESLEKKEEP